MAHLGHPRVADPNDSFRFTETRLLLYDCTLRLWDLATGKTLRILEGHTSSVDAAAALGDGRRGL